MHKKGEGRRRYVNPGSRRQTYVQCQKCGEIYCVDKKVSVEKLYITSFCPRCNCSVGLNCGQSKDDVYKFMDINIDPRYF
jgi:hypothetical protein